MKERQHFTHISARSWEHPADRAALSALQSIPGIDSLLKKLIGITTEKSIKLATLSSAVRCSEKQFPRIYSLHKEACRILDVEDRPELYVSQNPFLNAGATGVENPFIVLNTSLLETNLTDDEILAVIGHELGHCLSGHVLYKTLLQLLIYASRSMFNLPFSNIPMLPIVLALKEWDRKSELSADRAGLLVAQAPEVCYSLLMKMAGGTAYSEMNVDEFFAQAAEYEELDSLPDSVHKFLNLMLTSHPFPVLRLTELKTWVDSGAYAKICTGEFMQQGAEESHLQNLKAATDQYRTDVNNTRGTIADIAAGLFGAVDTVTDQASEVIDSLNDDKNTRTR